MPYKGSKSEIVKELIDNLPPGDHFYDLFGGGGSVAQYALLSGKYKYVHYNELDPLVFKAFSMAIAGDFQLYNRFITRDEFHALKNTDPYTALCFSFGNSFTTYLYSPFKEHWFKALHNALVLNDWTLINEIMPPGILSAWHKKYFIEWLHFNAAAAVDFYGKWYRENYDPDVIEALPEPWRLVHLERVNRLRELASLRKYFLNGRLILTNDSYDAVQLVPDAVLYCDPPYLDTGGYRFKFNHEDFYTWAGKQKNIFISEYEAPADFKLYFEINKRVLLSKDSNGKTVSEKVYTNPEFKERFILC